MANKTPGGGSPLGREEAVSEKNTNKKERTGKTVSVTVQF